MKKDLLKLTSNAIKQFKNILNNNNKYNSFRFQLKNGGCNGFEYQLIPQETSKLSRDHFKKDNLIINICDKSLLYVIGTEIDYNDSIMSKNFIFNNPNAKVKCGCGTSFNPFS